MPARLTLYLPSSPARVCPLRDDDEQVLGRDADCAIRVDDDRVSRRHALLRRQEGRWTLTDLRSKNGTQVDGNVARGAVPLHDTSWVSFGGLLARFEVLSEEALARSAEDQLRRWQSSMELQRRLDPSIGLAPLLERLIDSVLQLSATDRGFVLLADEEGELAITASRGVVPGSLLAADFAGSIGAVERAQAERRTVVCSDARHDPLLGGRASIAEHQIRALVCLPLLSLDRVVGVLYADSGKPGKAFTELDVEILEGLASHAALAITVARLDAELAGVVADLPEGDVLVGRLRGELGLLARHRATGALPPLSSTPMPRWSDLSAAHEERRGGA